MKYIYILLLTTIANILATDNNYLGKAKLEPLNLPIQIAPWTFERIIDSSNPFWSGDNPLKVFDWRKIINPKITSFSQFYFLDLIKKDSTQTICFAVANIEEHDKNIKYNYIDDKHSKIIECDTNPNAFWPHINTWVFEKELNILDDIAFFGLLGHDSNEKISILKNGKIYIKNKEDKWSNVLQFTYNKNDIITSCQGKLGDFFWITIYNTKQKKNFATQVLYNKENKQYKIKEKDQFTEDLILHVAIVSNIGHAWFIKKKFDGKYSLNIIDFTDENFEQKSPLECISINTDNCPFNLDSIHHLTALNDETAFFIDENNLSLYKLTNEGDFELLLKHTEPIDAIGIWDNRLVLTIRNQLYRYIPVNMAKVEDKNLDDQKEKLIKTLETASPTTPSNQTLSTPENTQEKPIEINTTEPITETVLPTIPSSQSLSTSRNTQEPLEEIKKSEPLIIEQSVGIKKSQPKLLVFEEETNLRKALSKKRKNPEKPIAKIVLPTTTSNQLGLTDINTKKPNPSFFEPLKHYAAVIYRMLPQIKQPTQNPIQTAAPQEEEKNVKQPGTYYQTLKNWFNNIRKWWLPF